jgi:hypothetical protein
MAFLPKGRKRFHEDPGETCCGATCSVASRLRLVAVEMLVRRAAEHYRSSSVPRSLSVERSASRAWYLRTPTARVHGSSAGSARHDGARLARPGGWGTIRASSLPGRRLLGSSPPEPTPRLVCRNNTWDMAPMLITRVAMRESSQLLDSLVASTRSGEAPPWFDGAAGIAGAPVRWPRPRPGRRDAANCWQPTHPGCATRELRPAL